MKDKTEWVELTERALQICQDNYKSNCGGCPIRTACVTHIGPGKDALNSWTERVNEYAESIA